MSMRYTERYRFDHGVHYFIAKTDKFRSFLQPPIAEHCPIVFGDLTEIPEFQS